MITANKAKALLMFTHSRLAQKMSTLTKIKDTNNDIMPDEDNTVQDQIDSIARALNKEGYSIEVLNAMPECFLASQLTYYYDYCLRTFNKHIKQGDEVVESIIGLNILSYLIDEKNVVNVDVDNLDLLAILHEYETKSSVENRRLVYKMIDVAAAVVEDLEKANYSRWAKQQRKRRK